jgi:hypothetical protein
VTAIEVLTPEEEWCERVWLGLRTACGIPGSLLSPDAAPLLDYARAQALIVDRPAGHIALTGKGMAVADEFVRRVLLTAKVTDLPRMSRNRHMR